MIFSSRSLKIILFFILLGSCNEGQVNKDVLRSPENSKTVQVKLVDSLGIVTLSIPFLYDTFFTWTHYSDCGKSCDLEKYRFQPRTLRITKESGWIWLGEPKDSIERFTISHSGYFPFHNVDTAKNLISHSHLKSQINSDPANPPIISDTIEKINDRYYSIFIMRKSDTIQSEKVLAITTIKGNFIRFQYDLLTKREDSITRNFIKNSIDLIHTIHINKGI